MRVMFVIHSLTSVGGAERILTLIANYFSKKGHKVTIAVFDKERADPFYPVSPEITMIPMNIHKASKISDGGDFLLGCLRIRNTVKLSKPELIISFLTYENIITLCSTLGLHIPVIVSERNDPRRSTKSRMLSWLRMKLYPKAHYVVCQTTNMMKLFDPPLMNGIVIPNPVTVPVIQEIPSDVSLPDGKLLFAVGGMTKEKIHQKGFDILIDVFSRIAEKHPSWNLVIFGDGPERNQLLMKLGKLGLQERVFLPGNIGDIFSVLPHGDMFVLSSRYEGFPNALCEAMSCGLPPVSFNCPTGPSDIIRHGIDGLLVEQENEEALEKSLNELINDEETRRAIGEQARKVTQRFNESTVMKMWYDVLM